MLRRYALACALAAGAASAPTAQPAPAPPPPVGGGAGSRDTLWLPVLAGWRVGDHRAFEVRQVDVRRSPDGPTTADSTTTAYDVTVFAETEGGGYLVRWRPYAYSTTKAEPAVGAFAAGSGVEERLEKEGYLLRLDPDGAFVALENAGPIRTLFAAVMDSLAARDTAFATQGREFFEAMRSDEVIEQTLLAPMVLYYSYHGMQYALGAKSTYATELPFALGGAPIPATARLHVLDHDPGRGTFALRLRQEVAPADFAVAIARFMRRAGAPEAAVAEMETSTGLEFGTDARFTFELGTGWVREVTLQKTYAHADGRVTSTLTIRPVAEEDGAGPLPTRAPATDS